MSRRGTIAALALALAALAATAGCKKSDRHFVPAPPANRDAGFELETVPGGDVAAVPIEGDGGVAVAGDGDGDGGDGDTRPESGAFTKPEVQELLTFLDKELPADLGEADLFTKLARKCGGFAKCTDQACAAVLSTCSGADKAGCGTMLLKSCPAFQAMASGQSGEQLATYTETWIRDLWGDLVVKLRLSLPDKMHKQIDKLATRHQL